MAVGLQGNGTTVTVNRRLKEWFSIWIANGNDHEIIAPIIRSEFSTTAEHFADPSGRGAPMDLGGWFAGR
jgi:hypothetical protein